MPYSNEELEFLLGDLEADLVERKESWKGETPDKGRQAICAFANDLPDHRKEGVLFIGANDKGVPTGLEVSDQLLLTLGDTKSDGRILPPPSLVVEKRKLLGSEVAVVHVRPSDSPPVRCDGRIWIRIGPKRGVATAQEERILAEKRLHGDKPFDVRACAGSEVKDLDMRFFETEYLTSAFSSDVLEANERSLTERATALKMLSGAKSSTPTNLALIVMGINARNYLPGDYVQFLRIDGDDLSEPIIDAAQIDGRIDEIIRRTEDKFVAHNRVKVDIVSSEREIRTYQYPLGALQQVLRNAVMHRTYEASNAPIRVTWFNERIEMQSPGGPFGAVSVDNFGQPGVTDYRNPSLSESLRVLGFVQRFGVGIATARNLLEKNGNSALEFRVDGSFVTAIIPARC